jgi:predicted RNA binding protein YcfA (HicA-like mRNA interferase family)
MTGWPATKARRVLAALLRIGWTIKRQTGSHRTLARDGWPDASPHRQSNRPEARRSVGLTMVNLIAADDLHAKWMKAPGYAKATGRKSA